jgi:GNAT superfamily N-acetyltransferase
MLARFQSAEAVAAQIAEGCEYYMSVHDETAVGYLALVPDAGEDSLMISKLYVTRSVRGHGFGRDMLSFAEEVCRERNIATLWLTVNKNNTRSIEWYAQMGFVNAGPVVQDIGAGFVMDDYRLTKAVV